MRQTLYSGEKYSQYVPPSILHGVLLLPIRCAVTAALCSPVHAAQDSNGLHKLSGCFSPNDSAKPNYTAYYFETPHYLLKNYSVFLQHQRQSPIYLISH